MLCCQLDISAFADLLYHALQDAVLTEEIADHGTYNLCKCFLGALELLIKTIDSTVCSTCCVHSMYIYVHGKGFKCKLARYWTHNFTSHTSHKFLQSKLLSNYSFSGRWCTAAKILHTWSG